MSLNKVMLIGNVGKDPEIRYLDGNNPAGGNTAKVAQFTLATTERFRDRSGELRENTEWHNIVAWRNNADVAEKYIRKGTQLYIEGKLRTRSWTDQSGNKRYITEINVDTLQLLGKRSDNPGGQDAPVPGGYAPAQPARSARPSYQQPAPEPIQKDAPSQGTPIDIALETPEDDLPF